MKSFRGVAAGLVGAVVVLSMPIVAFADTVNVPPALNVPAELSLAEVKITGNEFVMFLNNTGSAINDLSSYWLYAFNNSDPMTAGVSSSSQQLPAASLGDGQTILLSANGGATCGAAVTGKLSLSLADSGGYLEIVRQVLTGAGVATVPSDAVSWTSNVAPYSDKNIITPTSSSAKAAYASYRYQKSDSPLTFWWQPADVDASDSCQLDVELPGTGAPQPGPRNPGAQLSPGTPPPAKIISFVTGTGDVSNSGPSLPVADQGLMAPMLTELLPNPASPKTDAADEFVELYNPNAVPFDLSGFKLRTGTITAHSYTFPAGTTLPAEGFKAFYSSQISISLSNSGTTVSLLDPLGAVISAADAYGKAGDGLAWALADGVWYWTTQPTPNAANVIAGNITPSVTSLTAATPSKSISSGSVQGASTVNATSAADQLQVTPIHPWTLALVAALAILYGLYEYRVDVANRLHQFRKYRAARRGGGK